MSNTNAVIISGRVVSDPKVSIVESNAAEVANFRIASNRVFYTDKVEKQEATFVDIEAWRGNAKTVKNYVHKGDLITITGRLKSDEWLDKEGQKKSKLKVVAEYIELSPKRDTGDGKTEVKNEKTGEEPPM